MAKVQANLTVVKNREFIQEYRPEINLADVYIFQKPYYLVESEYQILTLYEDKQKTWANRFLGMTVILLVTIIAKYLSSIISNEGVNITLWETMAFIISLVIYLFLLFLNQRFPSKKKKLIKEIDQYFQDNKKILKAFKKNE